jgi:hypothetical protein
MVQPGTAPEAAAPAASTAEQAPSSDERAEPAAESTASHGAPEGAAATAGPPAVAAPAKRRGAAIELHGGFLVAFGQPYVEISGAFVYQFSSKFSLGAWGGVVPNAPMPTVGLRLVFGNKVDGLAFVLDLGVLPGLGLYYRNFLLVLEFVPTSPPILGFRAGYSIFLGRR